MSANIRQLTAGRPPVGFRIRESEPLFKESPMVNQCDSPVFGDLSDDLDILW